MTENNVDSDVQNLHKKKETKIIVIHEKKRSIKNSFLSDRVRTCAIKVFIELCTLGLTH